MSATMGVFGRACPHCGLLCPPGLQAHIECALEATRKGVVEEAVRRGAKEQRDERAKLDAAALVARRQEKERIVELIRELRQEYATVAQRSTEPGGLASTLAVASQRAAALGELLQRLGED